jgi:rRNA processing protein Krr1/Pno1
MGVSENDFSDLIVKGTYENGKVVNPMPLTASNFTIDRRPGEDRKVTIAVDNEKVSFTIDIEPRKVVALELLSPPDVINYYVGESFNIHSAMKLWYNDYAFYQFATQKETTTM